MKRVLLILGGMFLCASALMAQTCVGARPGLGPDIPCNYTANGTTLSLSGPLTIPSYSGDFTKANVCWDTNNASDSLVEIEWYNGGYSAWTVSRYVYSATLVTHHCLVVDSLYPAGTYLVNVDSCTGTGGPSPYNCSRTNVLNSVGPAGSQQYNGIEFTTGTPNSADTTVITAQVTGTNLIYQTHGGSLGFPILWSDGPIPAYLVFTTITMDGSGCTVSIAGGACGSTGISFQPDCGGSEVQNPAKNNYNTTVFNSGTYSGKYFCQVNSPANGLDPGSISARLAATVGASVGSHTLSVTFQATTTGQVNMGSSSTVTWTFSVAAVPTPTLTAPTIFPTIPNLGAYNDSIASLGTLLYYQHWQQAITAPGVYCNGTMSSTDMAGFPPCSVLNYGGDRVTAQIHDYIGAVTTGWTANHAYNVGDMICTAAPSACTTGTNYVFVVHVAGTSGATIPGAFVTNIPGAGVLVTDGTAKWYNAGNESFWDLMTLRTSAEWQNYEGTLGNYTYNSEWNMFPLGTAMNCWRQYGTAACEGANYVRPIAYQLYPVVTGFGGTNQNQIINNFKHNPTGTLRILPYGESTLITDWLMTGTEPMTSVDEVGIRADLLIGTLNELENGAPLSTKVTGSVLDIPSFDNGLGAEALIQLYDTQVYEGLTPDARIPVELLKNADWLYSNQFNLTGNDYGFPYEMWTVPYYSTAEFQSNLNMLYAPVYTWLWEMYGDSCTLPTSGVSCLTAGDNLARHANDSVVGTGKNFNQIQKLFCDYYKWRTNSMPGTDLCILPDQNAYRGFAYPNLMEPYNSLTVEAPPTCAPGSTTATCVWYSFKPITAATVTWGLTKTTINTVQTGAASVVYDANVPMYKNTVNLVGLPTNTLIYFGVGGQDSAGNTAFSSDNRYCSTCSSPPTYSFTTSGTCTLAITTASLPSATQGQQYNAQLAAQCGMPPYNWAITVGQLPTGLSLASSTGAITGISSTQGTVNFTVQVTDSATPTPGTATKPLSITTVPATVVIGPSLLPNGTVGTAYSQQLTASGGTPPYGWTIAGGSLPTSLSLGAINGKITGTPSVAGIYSFTIQVCGLYSTCGSRPYTVTIQSSGTSIPGMSGAATMSGSGIVQQ